MNEEEIIKKIKESDHLRIKYGIPDVDGILRSKYIHKNKFLEAAKSEIGFCDVVFGWDSGDQCYDNSMVTGWHSGYPDAKAKLDFATFREIPWENDVPFFIADFSNDEKYASASCPRSLLKRVKKQCSEMGFNAIFAQEFEWFNFRGTPSEIHDSNFQQLQPITPGMFGYSGIRTSLNHNYVAELFNLLEKFNVAIEGVHTETGPGVYEATVIYDDILAAADKAMLFKSSVKEIAYRHNFVATFMAKWNTNLPGCGGHIHQSLWDESGTRNLFFSENGSSGTTELLEHYIAGQLVCLPEILPMYAPNVNSYKRIGHGDWAPATPTWGIDNRTAAIRVIPGSKKSSRIELRVPGADTNAYLAMAASLASGLYGIKNKLKLKEPETKGNAYNETEKGTLSTNLADATEKMVNSTIARELFGAAFVEHFTKTREWEWRQFEKNVSDWELKRYFEII
ncbi:glutamine synthetase [Maribellus comscasis]|uniref:Glutamine synthetase n=1 Tax=Maribellus comscasis TaxID=2681766 RepID=A0A6I6JS26_9BACT|nr:glutamine synthetase family protein [Maribellus comscasis]QGY45241.1 glutamine synthetase [Maribellus comscasis]